MAQNRDKDETLELKVPAETSCLNIPTITTGCGSVGLGHGSDPVWLDRTLPISDDDRPDATAQVSVEMKRAAVEGEKRLVKRCTGCRKRVGLTGLRCRCGDLFCWEHRYSDRHNCSYDYKAAARAAIARQNPVVRAAKIIKL